MKHFFFRLFVNNAFSNFFIRTFGFEKLIYQRFNPYLYYKADANISAQENAGYSNRPEINEVISKSKDDLEHAVAELCKQDASILDIGCGPGMYLKLFKDKKYSLSAIDLNASMLEAARKNVPEANFICGNFIDLK